MGYIADTPKGFHTIYGYLLFFQGKHGNKNYYYITHMWFDGDNGRIPYTTLTANIFYNLRRMENLMYKYNQNHKGYPKYWVSSKQHRIFRFDITVI